MILEASMQPQEGFCEGALETATVESFNICRIIQDAAVQHIVPEIPVKICSVWHEDERGWGDILFLPCLSIRAAAGHLRLDIEPPCLSVWALQNAVDTVNFAFRKCYRFPVYQ